MLATNVDVVVIGGGPGGYTAAIRAAQLGAKVKLVERADIGGVCLNRGCIPTKALLKTVRILGLLVKSAAYGIEVPGFSLDTAKAMKRKDQVIGRHVKGLKGLLDANGIELLKGTGRMADRNTLVVVSEDGSETAYQTRKTVIATGSRPYAPPIPGLNGRAVYTSDDILGIGTIPRSVVIVGGGPIGVEFAQILSGLGSDVTLAEMMPQLLPLEDRDVASQVLRGLEKSRTRVLTGSKVREVKDTNEGYKTVVLETDKRNTEVMSEAVLIATGRMANTSGLGLEKIGVRMERGLIQVDDHMATNVPGIYAIGDVVGGAYAHVATAQAMVAAENVMGHDSVFHSNVVPRCVFTSPEVAAVGLTESEALRSGRAIKTGYFPLQASSAATAMGEAEGFAKVLIDSETEEILGVHLVGPGATEVISVAAIAMTLEATADDLARVMVPHPTISEALKEAALAAEGKAINIPNARRGNIGGA